MSGTGAGNCSSRLLTLEKCANIYIVKITINNMEDERLQKIEQKLADLTEIVLFIKDNMVMKSEFNEFKQEMHEFKFETEKELHELSWAVKNLSSEVADIKRELENISIRSKEDADAEAMEIVSLRRRVEFLEDQLRQIKLKIY